MKKKRYWFDTLKSWWVLVPIIGFILAFSSNILAMWNTPKELSETQKSVNELAAQLQTYTASEKEANDQRDSLIRLLAGKLLGLTDNG